MGAGSRALGGISLSNYNCVAHHHKISLLQFSECFLAGVARPFRESCEWVIPHLTEKVIYIEWCRGAAVFARDYRRPQFPDLVYLLIVGNTKFPI